MERIAAANGYDVVVGTWEREPVGRSEPIQRGIKFTIMRLRSSYGVRSLLFMPIWLMFALCRSLFGGFSVIQARNLDSLIPAIIASKISRRKVIYDMADFYADSYAYEIPILRKLSRSLEISVLRRADALILSSDGQYLQIGRTNLPMTKMIFYNVPMDQPESLLPSSEKSISERITLFYGGIMSHERFEALRNVVEAVRGLPVQVVIAGFGEHPKLFAQLKRVGDVKLLGKLTHSGILRRTAEADAILLPYLSSQPNHLVTLSNKFFDAMAMGTMVLAPRNTLTGEITESEGFGLLMDYGDVSEIRSCVKKVIKMEESERLLVGDRGKALLLRRFNPERIGNEYLQILGSV